MKLVGGALLARHAGQPARLGGTLGLGLLPAGVLTITCGLTFHRQVKGIVGDVVLAFGNPLGIGQTVRYRSDKVIHDRDRETSYAIYDAAAKTWSPWTPYLPATPIRHAN